MKFPLLNYSRLLWTKGLCFGVGLHDGICWLGLGLSHQKEGAKAVLTPSCLRAVLEKNNPVKCASAISPLMILRLVASDRK